MVRLFVIVLLGLSRIFPPSFLLALAPVFTKLIWFFYPKLKRIAMRNLELCFKDELPKNLRSRLAYLSFLQAYIASVEFLYLTHMEPAKVKSLAIKVTGWAHLENALAEGKGVIGLAMHFGNWEFSGIYLPLCGIPLCAVGKEQRDEFFTELAFRTRSSYGIENISRDDKFSSSVVRALREGKVLGLLADQNGGVAGRMAPFFGIPASTARGPAMLHLKFGSPMLLVVARRLAPFQFEIIVKPPVPFELTGRLEEDELRILTAVNQTYEEMIREEPAQWLWVHKRFKTRPAGEPNLYS